MKVKELDIVALTQDVPALGMVAGDAGTVVYVHSNGEIEIEFIAADGFTIGLLQIDPALVREPTPDELKRKRPTGPDEPFMERLVNGKLWVPSQPAK